MIIIISGSQPKNIPCLYIFTAENRRGDGILSKKASITVEASLVCPVFIFAAIALINIISWFKEAEDIQKELTQSLQTRQYMSYFAVEAASGNEDKDIVIKKKNQSVTGRAYVGVTTIGSTDDGEDDVIVYITPTGRVYHVSEVCTYLKSDVRRIDFDDMAALRNESGGKYYSCEVCAKDTENEEVYITSYGNRYHCNFECKSIRRNYIAVYKKDISNKNCCMKCGNGL